MNWGFSLHHLLKVAVCALLFLVSPSAAEDVRSSIAFALSPLWQSVSQSGESFFTALFAFRYVDTPASSKEKDLQIERLAVENHRLRAKLEEVKEWMISEEYLDRQISLLGSLRENSKEDKGYFKRRIDSLMERIGLEMQAVPAQVIFRDASLWHQFMWVNVGTADNLQLGYPIIQKNSPVVVGNHLIGVVERVEEGKSLVRLITDRQCAVAVRAYRGVEQSLVAQDQAEALFGEGAYADHFKKIAETETALRGTYLAKGVLQGGLSSRWRNSGKRLVGMGFNYDYEDEEGPARDLRSGLPMSKAWSADQAIHLIDKGDLLVTTGYDGVFPEGLYVGTVAAISPLPEGSIAYEIEALPSYPKMDRLKTVLILPPLAKTEAGAHSF